MVTHRTERLKLETPATGTYGWHVEWARNMDIIDAHPGILVCTSTTRPAAPWIGQVVFESDTKKLLVFNAGAWREIAASIILPFFTEYSLETLVPILKSYDQQMPVLSPSYSTTFV